MLFQRDHRGPARLPDREWMAVLHRVRSEFDEMPCTRLTLEQARAFFGLPEDEASRALLERLAEEGFLQRTEQGEYVRRSEVP
jgi:predicted transcriptional regulator of viral defense system